MKKNTFRRKDSYVNLFTTHIDTFISYGEHKLVEIPRIEQN